MSDPWMPLTITVLALAAGGLYLLSRSATPMVFANAREERLTRRLARSVGCTLAQALPAIRREVDIAPSQSDDTLVKRAAYHYGRDIPEAPCSVYRDRAPG